MNNSKLLSLAVKITKYAHNMYDSKQFPRTTNWYHNHFLGGVNPWYNQTKNCLIIEEHWPVSISYIHTPLGCWKVCGNGFNTCIDDVQPISQQIHQDIKLEMICPNYQTKYGSYGPYWLVTEFDNIELPKGFNTELLPLIDVIKEGDAKLEHYLEQKQKFYKAPEDYLSYEQGQKIFEEYLGEWLRSGLIKDKDNISLDILNYRKNFLDGINKFKASIDKRWWKYLMLGTENEILFKAIYLSKLNDNSST